MDQPFSRSADALLDRQYWSPDDPQKRPYDDTGWSFPALFDTEAVRVTDRQVLAAAMSPVEAPLPLARRRQRAAARCSSSPSTGTTRCSSSATGSGTPRSRPRPSRSRPPGTTIRAAPGWCGGSRRMTLERAAADAGVTVDALAAAPKVATRPVAKPRIALLHTWLDAQTEGWWRQRLDLLKIPYDYISTQDVAANADLAARYDVILFPPVGAGDPLLHRHRPADVGRADALEDDAGDAEPRRDRRHGRSASRPRLRRARAPAPVRGAGRPAGRRRGHGAVADRNRPGARRARRRVPAASGGRQRARRALPRPQVADRRRPGRPAVGLQRRRAELRAEQRGAGWLGRRQEGDRPTGRGGPKDVDTPEGRPGQPAAPKRRRSSAGRRGRWRSRSCATTPP